MHLNLPLIQYSPICGRRALFKPFEIAYEGRKASEAAFMCHFRNGIRNAQHPFCPVDPVKGEVIHKGHAGRLLKKPAKVCLA